MANNASVERHLVAHGNYPIKEGGLPLFSCPTGRRKPGEKLFYNGAPGQIVAFTHDPSVSSVPITVDLTNLDTINGDLYLGVFVDQDGDGAADDVRLIAGEHLTKCDVDEVSVGKPDCGQAGIEATTIDCVNCSETYTANVRVQDNFSRSWSPLFKGYCEFTATYSPQCHSCTDCAPEANCKEVVCGIVEAINGGLDLNLNDELYPDWKGRGLPRPYKAVMGHDNWFSYCLTPDAAVGDCETCGSIDAITQVTVNSVVYPLQGNLDPSTPTKTLIAQLDNIAHQIEAAFDKELGINTGFAVVSKGIGKCCDIQLHVVTCDPTFTIGDDVTPLTPCNAVDPNISFPAKRICGSCEAPGPDYVPECWFAVITPLRQPECSCYLEDVIPTWNGVSVDVSFLKDANDCYPSTKKFTILDSISPRNHGTYIRFLEYKYGFPAGRGRNYRASNYRKGWLGLPDKTSRVKNAVTARCEAMYCSYFLGHQRTYKNQLGSSNACTVMQSVFHIENTDLNTINSFEPFYAALVEANNGTCKVVSSVSCLT